MATLSYAVLFIGLIFDILLIMFIIVAILLIYSLLMITVETKAFETGVMRLVGLSKGSFVAMIFTQAACFVFPAVILGFGCALPCIFLIYELLFSSDLGFRPSIMPDTSAIVQALAIGLLIPTASAIVPIRRALAVSLNDALNSGKKAPTVKVSFTDSKKLDLVPYILFGSIAVGYGMTIYLVLPLSLLEGNFTLILQIFFLILMGLLIGITLFVTNLQGLLELLLMHVTLFWEKRSMRELLKKNLIAHRPRNKLTSIIYSLTLGCIIFLLVTATLELNEITAINTLADADIVVRG